MALTAVRKFSLIYQGNKVPVLAIREDPRGIEYLLRGRPEGGADVGAKIWVHDTHVDYVGISVDEEIEPY